jgi:truncated hemoglobin YjbI
MGAFSDPWRRDVVGPVSLTLHAWRSAGCALSPSGVCEPVRWGVLLFAVRHTLGEFFGSVYSFSGAALRHRQFLAGEGGPMKQDKNLQYCMDCLRSMQERDGLEPEQRSALEKAKVRLKALRRSPTPTRREIFEAVRQVAEAIVNNFVRRL